MLACCRRALCGTVPPTLAAFEAALGAASRLFTRSYVEQQQRDQHAFKSRHLRLNSASVHNRDTALFDEDEIEANLLLQRTAAGTAQHGTAVHRDLEVAPRDPLQDLLDATPMPQRVVGLAALAEILSAVQATPERLRGMLLREAQTAARENRLQDCRVAQALMRDVAGLKGSRADEMTACAERLLGRQASLQLPQRDISDAVFSAKESSPPAKPAALDPAVLEHISRCVHLFFFPVRKQPERQDETDFTVTRAQLQHGTAFCNKLSFEQLADVFAGFAVAASDMMMTSLSTQHAKTTADTGNASAPAGSTALPHEFLNELSSVAYVVVHRLKQRRAQLVASSDADDDDAAIAIVARTLVALEKIALAAAYLQHQHGNMPLWAAIFDLLRQILTMLQHEQQRSPDSAASLSTSLKAARGVLFAFSARAGAVQAKVEMLQAADSGAAATTKSRQPASRSQQALMQSARSQVDALEATLRACTP